MLLEFERQQAENALGLATLYIDKRKTESDKTKAILS